MLASRKDCGLNSADSTIAPHVNIDENSSRSVYSYVLRPYQSIPASGTGNSGGVVAKTVNTVGTMLGMYCRIRRIASFG